MAAPLAPDVDHAVTGLVRAARAAARTLALASSTAKDDALRRAATGLRAAERTLLEANRGDLERTRASGESAAFLDRLTLTPARIDAMASGLEQIAALPDPVGETMAAWRRPNGLEIAQVRVPIGVVFSIYESRPNVTADSAGLCLKTANACLLKGGSESQATSGAIADVIRAAAEAAGLPRDAVQLVTGGREVTRGLLHRDADIDVVIARGGEALKRTIIEESRIPVVKHFEGICHLYVDARADLTMAERICLNGKVQRPSVCNALENLLVHEAVAPAFLPGMVRALRAAGCEVRGCPATRAIVPDVVAATDADWDTEYLDLVLSVCVVRSLDDAIGFIARHSTGLAEAIVTDDYRATERFLREVDSACVFVNASTRFTDGFEFGFGAEVGISTNRLHARGPMGLRELTTYKYQVRGDGQIRELMPGVGILGGTFDPIHLAHLRAGEELYEACALDELRFVPCAVPPHKPAAGLTAAAHRLRMVELAVAGRAGFRAWDVELARAGPSYTVDTLRALRAEVGAATRVVMALGRDAFAEIHTWKDVDILFALADVVVLTRPPDARALALDDFPVAAREAFGYDPGSAGFRHASGHRVTLLPISALDISATDVRARVRAGRSIRYLVPDPVREYVHAHGLYDAPRRTAQVE